VASITEHRELTGHALREGDRERESRRIVIISLSSAVARLQIILIPGFPINWRHRLYLSPSIVSGCCILEHGRIPRWPQRKLIKPQTNFKLDNAGEAGVQYGGGVISPNTDSNTSPSTFPQQSQSRSSLLPIPQILSYFFRPSPHPLPQAAQGTTVLSQECCELRDQTAHQVLAAHS
jgi:hypothetical protein